MKAIALSLFALLLVAGSACTVTTNVDVSASPRNALTGKHCKLQRELRNQHQQTDFWCWAASAHTVIEYLRQEPITQCLIPDGVFRKKLEAKWDEWLRQHPVEGTDDTLPHPNCCMSTAEFQSDEAQANVKIAKEICWRTGWPEDVFSTEKFRMSFDGYKYDLSIPYPHGLSWDEIVNEICEDRPIITGILFSPTIGGGGHTIVVGGYSEMDDGSQWVHIYDPGYNTLEDDYYLWPYDVYLGDPGVFTHARDYTNISLP